MPCKYYCNKYVRLPGRAKQVRAGCRESLVDLWEPQIANITTDLAMFDLWQRINNHNKKQNQNEIK